MTSLERQRALVRRADLDGLAVDRALGALWQQLLAVLRDSRTYADSYHRSLALLRRLPEVIAATMRKRLAGTYRLGHRAAVLAVAGARRRTREDEDTPRDLRFVRHPAGGNRERVVYVSTAALDAAWAKGHPDFYIPSGGGGGEIAGRRAEFQRFLQKGVPIQAPRAQYDPDTGAVDFLDGRHRFSVLRDLGVERVAVQVPKEQKDTFAALFPVPEPEGPTTASLADFLMPSPDEATIFGFLQRFVNPQDWQQIGTPTDKRMPETLAHQIAASVSQGKTQREIAADLRPYLEGGRVRARRAARTFGLYAINQAQERAWDGLGDMVDSYTVHATLDEYTRPEHRARNGTTYYRNPGPGQKGFDEMPHPPLESDGSLAWNCRCFLTPNLAD